MSEPVLSLFLSAWQSSASVGEVARRLGMPPRVALDIAADLREEGVPLRALPVGLRTFCALWNDRRFRNAGQVTHYLGFSWIKLSRYHGRARAAGYQLRGRSSLSARVTARRCRFEQFQRGFGLGN